MTRQVNRKRNAGLTGDLTPRGVAVMRALRDVRRHAPGFVVACGVLPEVSESASERLHSIAHDVAGRHLDGRRHLLSLQEDLRQLGTSADVSDRIERDITAVIGAEATAAYLLGLSVGLAVHALPERLTRSGR
jgi:hypothetical protein